MKFEGQVEAVVSAMSEKKWLLKCGKAETGPRPVCFGGGGIMYGCEFGGMVTAFNERGYGDVLDSLVCLSTSSPGGAYHLSRNPRVGTSIYSEECCTPEFISLWRLGRLVDVNFLDRVFRGSTGKAINAGNVLGHRTKLYIGVTNAKTGKQSLIVPKTEEELFRAILASISIPGWSGSGVEINSRRYIDGACSHPLPIKQMVRMLRPTHVLVVPNRTSNVPARLPILETALNATLWRGRISAPIRALASRRRTRLIESLEWLLEESGIPTMIAWSEGTIGRLTRNPDKIREAAALAEKQWSELLP